MKRSSTPLAALEGVEEAAALHLLEAIQNDLSKEEGALLPGIGTFRKNGCTVTFEPDSVLLTEVNALYAGLHPLLLVKSGTSWVGESDTAYVAPPEPSPVVPAVASEEQLPSLPPEVPFYETNVTGSDSDEATPVDSGIKSELPAKTVIEAPKSDEIIPKEEKTGRTEATKTAKTLRMLLVSGVAAAAVLTAAFLLYRLISPADGPVPVPTVTVIPVTPPVYHAPDTVLKVDEPDQRDSLKLHNPAPTVVSVVEKTKVQEVEQESNYGLHGTLNTGLLTWYALVVHSLDLPEKAEKQRILLDKAGLRVAVQQAVVNEKNVWRVGLGQFATVDEAQRAAADLPEPFKNRYFIKRFSQ